MNKLLATGILALTAMFAGGVKADLLDHPDGCYTIENSGQIHGIRVVKTGECPMISHPSKKSGNYRIHTFNGWLKAASSDAGAEVTFVKHEKDATEWHAHAKGDTVIFLHNGNRANAISVVGINPNGGGTATGKLRLRRNNANGDGMADQVWALKRGH